MKKILIIAIVGTLFLVCGWTLAGLSEELENVNSSRTYGVFVDNYVQKCEAKAKLLDSSSLNIRKSAVRATLKGAFIKSNREAMIDYLAENEVPHNADRIEYHLTQQFTESFHPQKVYAMMLEEGIVQ